MPFLESHFRNNRQRFFDAIALLALVSTGEDDASLKLIRYVSAHQTDTTKTIVLEEDEIPLNWVPANWLRFIRAEAEPNQTGKAKHPRYQRNRLEILAFWTLADELGTGDIAIADSDRYADYRTQLLSDAECETRLASYCQATGLPTTPAKFAEHYRKALTQSWDSAMAHIAKHPFKLDKTDRPKLPKAPGKSVSPSLRKLQDQITSRMERRTLLQILCEADQAMKYTRHFGVPSGANPKLKQPKVRYISTVFCYGTNLRPAQTARHMRGGFSDDDFFYVDRRHMRIENLERASIDLINGTTHFSLPSLWGTGKRMAGDGTHMPTWSKNLVGEMHIRYGAYGGIAYHFVGDTYAVIFSTFITCGTWEAVYILDAFMKNTSQIRPNIIHADTQGQSLPVFALSNLMGVQLMPRIRNWKDKGFYLPQRHFDAGSLDTFVDGSINWDLIRAHHKDFMKVVLSIQAGKILPSTLLRILTSYSSKNKLYVAFRELGRVCARYFCSATSPMHPCAPPSPPPPTRPRASTP
ncbi:MAG: transposase [Anaerolineae bacterium]|nr:transposase [Anaerolineae bacterium]